MAKDVDKMTEAELRLYLAELRLERERCRCNEAELMYKIAEVELWLAKKRNV